MKYRGSDYKVERIKKEPTLPGLGLPYGTTKLGITTFSITTHSIIINKTRHSA